MYREYKMNYLFLILVVPFKINCNHIMKIFIYHIIYLY